MCTILLCSKERAGLWCTCACGCISRKKCGRVRIPARQFGSGGWGLGHNQKQKQTRVQVASAGCEWKWKRRVKRWRERTGRRESGARELVGGEEDGVAGHLTRERRREAAEEAAHALLAPHLAHHTDWPAAHTRTQPHLASASAHLQLQGQRHPSTPRAPHVAAHKRYPENNSLLNLLEDTTGPLGSD